VAFQIGFLWFALTPRRENKIEGAGKHSQPDNKKCQSGYRDKCMTQHPPDLTYQQKQHAKPKYPKIGRYFA
jgi:hypothetical protein